jgi:hypothetical protein
MRLFLSLLLAILLTACGGGERNVFTQAQVVVPDSSKLATLSAHPSIESATNGPIDATALFDWAQKTYPNYFPTAEINRQLDVWTYRYYSKTDIFLGVNTAGDVAGLIGRGNGVYTWMPLGKISDYYLAVSNSSASDSTSTAPTLSVSGRTYLRDDTIAYPVSPINLQGIPEVSVGLGNSEITSDIFSGYSLGTSAPNDGAYLQLYTEKSSYQPGSYPVTRREDASVINLGLYPGVAATPRSGFAKAVITHDVGGYYPGVYSAGLFASTYDRVKSYMNANMVVYADSAVVTKYDLANNQVSISSTSTVPSSPSLFPESVVADLASQAHNKDLRFMMMLGIYPDVPLISTYFANGPWTVPSSNTAFWDSWFNQYTTVLMERARIAKDASVDEFAIGFNLDFMIDKGGDRWKAMINAIRSTGYTGKISYFGAAYMEYSSNAFASLEQTQRNEFMSLFDAVGLDFYTGIAITDPAAVLAREQTRADIRNGIAKQLNSVADAPVPLYVMIGTPSVHGGIVDSTYIEPCAACNSTALNYATDYMQQADMYQAACEVINNTPTGNGRVMGLFTWGYHYRDDFTYLINPGDSYYDKSANVRGKPAEAVLKYWYSNW